MSLPAQEHTSEHQPERIPANITHLIRPDNPPRVLLVDDDESLVYILQETLAREGYKIVTAFSGPEALLKSEQEDFALNMSDQKMPQMSGTEFFSRIQQIQPDATRVLMTGVVELNTIVDSVNKGEIYRFLVKPWLHEELIVTVRNAVQRHELIRHNARLHEVTRSLNERLGEL